MSPIVVTTQPCENCTRPAPESSRFCQICQKALSGTRQLSPYRELKTWLWVALGLVLIGLYSWNVFADTPVGDWLTKLAS